MDTEILAVDPTQLGKIILHQSPESLLEEWDIEWQANSQEVTHLQRAATELTSTDTPVAFPTETVYGLGADATRSSAVRAIFQAKQRPADNPLIVHFHSLGQLKELLGTDIPEIYKPLIQKFWPGPLTMILPNPKTSVLAPEVTCGLPTFGARMPRSLLALALLKLSGVPLAAPSANASTRPSPTAAEHVKDDLDGRIHTIIDGGPCDVGVESTVVDGLSNPPTILRPGGITSEQLQQCPGWENVVVGYKDAPEKGIKPRAPGMKYRHYSPKAAVILYEAGAVQPTPDNVLAQAAKFQSIGVIRTKTWPLALGLSVTPLNSQNETNGTPPHPLIVSRDGEISSVAESMEVDSGIANLLQSVRQHQIPHAQQYSLKNDSKGIQIWDVDLGAQSDGVARGLFSALRELDKRSVGTIFVEGVDDGHGDISQAVMNRLRKAAEVRV